MLATACWTDTDSWLHQRRAHAETAACRSAGGARCARIRTRSRTSWSAPWLHRPPTSEPRTTSVWGPPAHSSGYASRLRRSATRRTAPSVAAAPGCGKPVRVSGETSVASQHSAPPREAWRRRLPGPSGACRKGPPGGPWCGPAIAAGLLARLPQLLPEPPAPTPVPLSWHGGRGGRCGGMPRRGPRKHLLARRILERAHSDRSGAGVRGGGVGAVPPAWPGVPTSWRAQRALLLARLPHAAQPANAKAQRRLAARMAIARCRESEGSGYATRGFANHAASRPGRRPQGGEGGLPRQELAIRGMYANLRPGEGCGHQPRSVSRARFHPRRPSNPRRKRRTRAPALGVPASAQAAQ